MLKRQKAVSVFTAIIVSIMAMTSVSFAEGFMLSDGLTLDGSMRWRTEYADLDFMSATPGLETPYLRTRVGLKFTHIEKTKIYFQMQDSRMLGDYNSTLDNDTNLGVHQGYIKTMVAENCYLKVGRFEVSLGRERLVGPVGWSNIGRSFDGIMTGYKNDNFKLDVFSLKHMDRSFSPTLSHQDAVFYGANLTLIKHGPQFFVFWEYDQDKNITGDPELSRFTIGFSRSGECALYNRLDMNVDAAYQGGDEGASSISAFMAALDFTMKFEDSPINQGTVGFDVTSGDDEADDKIKWFDNLYYTGHKFRGYMDYFTGSPTYGLMDIFGKIGFDFIIDSQVMVDFHYFSAMAGNNKGIGTEIDLTAMKKLHERLTLQGGASVFYASEDYAGADSDPSYWMYWLLSAGF